MSIFDKLKKFYRSSSENKTQMIVFLGFMIVPVIGMTVLYILVRVFWVG